MKTRRKEVLDRLKEARERRFRAIQSIRRTLETLEDRLGEIPSLPSVVLKTRRAIRCWDGDIDLVSLIGRLDGVLPFYGKRENISSEHIGLLGLVSDEVCTVESDARTLTDELKGYSSQLDEVQAMLETEPEESRKRLWPLAVSSPSLATSILQTKHDADFVYTAATTLSTKALRTRVETLRRWIDYAKASSPDGSSGLPLVRAERAIADASDILGRGAAVTAEALETAHKRLDDCTLRITPLKPRVVAPAYPNLARECWKEAGRHVRKSQALKFGSTSGLSVADIEIAKKFEKLSNNHLGNRREGEFRSVRAIKPALDALARADAELCAEPREPDSEL